MCNPIAPTIARWGSIAVCLAVAACSSHGAQAPASPTTSLPSIAAQPSSSPSDGVRTQATAAYVGMWQEFAQAGTTSNWQDPELARFATGNALTTLTRSLYADHFNHVVTRGVPKSYPQVTAVQPSSNPDTVMISDCTDTTGTSKVMEGSGAPAPGDEPGGRRSIIAEVKKQPDGSWRVDRFAVEGLGTCS